MDSAGASGRKRSRDEVILEVREFAEGTHPPVLAYFTSPYDPCAASKENASSAELYTSAKSSQAQLVVRTEGNVDFVGSNVHGEGAATNPSIFALGVYDKETGSLKVVPALSNKVLRMEPRVRGLSYTMDYGNDKTEELDWNTRLARKNTLTNRFGTKKAKTALQKASRAMVKQSALGASDEQFKGFLEDAANQEGLVLTKQQVTDSVKAAVVRKIPPHDLEATTHDAAYPLNKIITHEEWGALDKDVSELVKASKKASDAEALRNNDKYWNLVIDRLPRIRVEGDRDGNAQRVRMLIYLNHLLSLFHATKGKVVAGRNPFLNERAHFDIPVVIYDKLKALFIQDVPRTDDNRGGKLLYRDYLLSYILLLVLKVDGYNSEVQDVAKHLKMTVTDLAPYYAQLGCKVEMESQRFKGPSGKAKVTLPLPLNFDSVDEDPKKRRRGRGR